MPCDSIITQSVALDKIGDRSLLKLAIESIDGLVVSDLNGELRFNLAGYQYSIAGGKLTFRGSSYMASSVGKIADQIKQAYSKQAILKTARLQGWKVKEVGKNKLQVIKGGF